MRPAHLRMSALDLDVIKSCYSFGSLRKKDGLEPGNLGSDDEDVLPAHGNRGVQKFAGKGRGGIASHPAALGLIILFVELRTSPLTAFVNSAA